MALALPEEVTTRGLSVFDILEEYERRKERYAARDEWYDRLENYYFEHPGIEGLPILPMNAQGRPLLRQVGERPLRGRMYSSRRLPPIVEDYAALMGRMPTSRVEPPEPSPEGEAKAEKLTKFLYSTYELSRMDVQQAISGHHLALLGDSVYLLEPEPDTLRVVWNVASPRTCYPSFYHGHRRFDVYDFIISELWETEDLVRQLDVRPLSQEPDNRTVVTYISPYQRTVMVGLKEPIQVQHVDWDLGFCPAAWVYNKVTGMMGMSDIGNSLGQQDFLDFCMGVLADGIVHLTYPIIGVKNPTNMGQDQMIVGPGAPAVTLQGDGDIIVRSTQGDPKAVLEIVAHSLEDMMSTTGTSSVRQQGQMKTSITTGRAVQSVQGPQSTRVEFKQQVLGDAIEALNRMTLQMQERAPALRRFKGPIYGNLKGVGFKEEFDASTDIDGWYRNKVTWQALVGMNSQQKMQVAAEGMNFQLWDDLEAREIAGVEDPMGMRKRVEAHKMWEAQLQAQMQQGQQQPQGQQPAPIGMQPAGRQGGGSPLTAGALRGALRGR